MATALVLAPEIVTSLAKVVVPAPAIVPPVHVTGPWNVCASPLSTLPLKRNGVVCVPPLMVTRASAPTRSLLIASVPRPCVVTPFRVLLPFLKSSTAPAAMLKSAGAGAARRPERPGVDVDDARVVEGDAEVDRRDRVRQLVVGADVVEVVRPADVVLDERRERVGVVEGAVVVDRAAARPWPALPT